MDNLLEQGIAAYKAGKRDEARKIFIALVRQEPDNERAWGWMYQVSNTDQERIHCMKQALRINPKNEKALQLLNQLVAPPFPSDPSLTPISISSSKRVNSFGSAPQKSGNNPWKITSITIALVFICIVIPIGGYVIYNLTRPIPNTEANPGFEISIQTAIAQTQSVLPTNTPISNPTTNTPRPVYTPQSTPKTDDVKAYFNKVLPIMNSLIGELKEVSNEASQIQYNRELFYNQTWRNQIGETLDKLLVSANKMESIEPVPQQAQKTDDYLHQMASEIRMYVSNIRIFLDGGDLIYVYKATENMDRISVLTSLATEEVEKLSNP